MNRLYWMRLNNASAKNHHINQSLNAQKKVEGHHKAREKKAPLHCSSCRGQGNNRSTCKYIMRAPSTINALISQAHKDQVI